MGPANMCACHRNWCLKLDIEDKKKF